MKSSIGNSRPFSIFASGVTVNADNDGGATSAKWPIVGHELVTIRLAQAVEKDNVAHAYLISGLDQLGKQTLTKTFAQALLCTSRPSRPCQKCRACHLVQNNRHPDFLTLDLEWQSQQLANKSQTKSVSVDAVRYMNNELIRRPHEGKWKILMVPHVENLTTAAANAFLKTLEEPPSFVVIVLTTRDSELVLPTIRSRCQPIHLFPLAIAKIQEHLITKFRLEEPKATLIAKLSNGRIGWAIQATQDDYLLTQRADILSLLQQALKTNRAERLLMAHPLSKRNDPEVLRLWAGWWRDILLLQNNEAELIVNFDQRPILEQVAQQYQPPQIRTFLRELQRLLRLLHETNVNPRLLWEVLLLKLPYPY